MDTREPPARRAICLECRTLWREGAPCPHGRRHHVVSLDTEDGRVPEGLIAIDHPAPTRITDQDALERYLARIVPGQTSLLPDGARPLFPYDVVSESILPTDAEVEAIGRLVELPGMYRDAGRSWRMRDVPMVRVVEPPLHMPTYAGP